MTDRTPENDGTDESSAARPVTDEGATTPVWRSIWIRVAALAVVVAGVYVALVAWQGERIASGTSVAGVDLGGMNHADATTRLSAEATRLAKVPVTVDVSDGQRFTVVPADAGLAIDVPATLKGLGERTYNPVTLIGNLTGGDERDVVVRADQNKLADSLHDRAGTVLTAAPKDGSVSIEGGTVEVVRSTAGQGIDAKGTAERIVADWPAKRQFTAPVQQREPRLPNTEIDRFVKEFATPAVSGSVSITNGKTSAALSPRQIASVVTIKQAGGKLAATVDAPKAVGLALDQKPELETPARNAKVVVVGGKPQVTPESNGTTIDRAAFAPVLLKALTAADRKATVPTKPLVPKVTRETLKGIDTSTVMTEFRSRFPGGPSNRIRTQNIRVALAAINGTVVAPGQQFSLIQTLGGELSPDKGYGAAPTIQGGKERAAQGGGVSQVSTAMYNAAFFAGVRLDEHKAHSFWIERYPAGREATLWVPKIDNKWTNDTAKPIVIVSSIEGDEVVIRFMGQRKYEVSTTASEKYNIRQPKTVEDDHPGCLPVPTNIGFDIDVTRILKQGGAVVKTEKQTTSYAAADRVTCTHPSAKG